MEVNGGATLEEREKCSQAAENSGNNGENMVTKVLEHIKSVGKGTHLVG